MGTTPGGLPYPEQTDSVDVVRDVKALALAVDPHVGGANSIIRAADLTVAPGVWADLSDVIVNYPVRANVRYRVIGTGSCYVGGAGADISHRIYVAPQAAGSALAVLAPLVQKMAIANQLDFIATANGTVNVSFQVFANNPATGIVLMAGSSVSIGVAS